MSCIHELMHARIAKQLLNSVHAAGASPGQNPIANLEATHQLRNIVKKIPIMKAPLMFHSNSIPVKIRPPIPSHGQKMSYGGNLDS